MMRITLLLLFVAAAISGCSLAPPPVSTTQFAAGYQNLLCSSVAIADPVIDSTGPFSNLSATGTRDKLVQLFMRFGYKVEAMQPSLFDDESVLIVNSTFVSVGSSNRTVTFTVEDPMLDEIIYTANISVRDQWDGVMQDELWSAIENALRPDLAR